HPWAGGLEVVLEQAIARRGEEQGAGGAGQGQDAGRGADGQQQARIPQEQEGSPHPGSGGPPVEHSPQAVAPPGDPRLRVAVASRCSPAQSPPSGTVPLPTYGIGRREVPPRYTEALGPASFVFVPGRG